MGRNLSSLIEGCRLAAYGAAYFFAAGAFMSYWPVWLRDRGVTDPEIGTLFMTRQMVSVVSVLGMGLLAHRLGQLRGMLLALAVAAIVMMGAYPDRQSTRLNSSHMSIWYAVFCLKKKTKAMSATSGV